MKVHMGRYPKKGEQKVSVRIDPWDTWSMDRTLALIVHPMLKQLHKTNHGAPYTDDDDVPENIRSINAKPKKNEWDTDSNHFKRWDWIMREMIWAFGELVKDRDPSFCLKKGKYKWVKKEGEDLSERVTLVEPVYDMEKMKAYHARKKNAFRLFGKYYENLWD